jgi:hypothetical protein
VQSAGCCALSFIIDAAGILGDARLDGAAADAAVAAMAAVRAHAGSHPVQLNGCDLLGRIFLDDRNADAAWVRRGSAVLTAATAVMRAHPRDVDVLAASCLLIARLMLSTKENQHADDIGGVIEISVAAMRAFPAAAMLQIDGCDALCNTCYSVRENQLAAAAAGGLEVTISAMRTHASNAELQFAGCCTLGALATDVPRIQRRVGELGGVEAVVEAMRTCAVEPPPFDRADFFQRWGQMMRSLVQHQPINAHTAVAAGVIELLVEHMRAPPDVDTTAVFNWACLVLPCLAVGTGHDARAVLAGALEALEARRAEDLDYEAARLDVIRHLQPAKRRHDAAPCVVAGCKRCAGARESGLMCALPGCGARGRDGGAKKLLRCGTCRAACYCGPAHQREDWRRHKSECGAATHDDDDDQAAGAS